MQHVAPLALILAHENKLEVSSSKAPRPSTQRVLHHRDAGHEPVSDPACPEWHPSQRQLRKAEGIEIVRRNREEANQNLCFSSRPFVLCGLPLRALPAGQFIYERRNGNFVLQITGHPEFGVPFGQDRIVPIFLATLSVRQKSQTIRFRSAAEMLETFGMQKGGAEYRRLIAAFERIFGATMFFGTESTNAKAKVIQRSRFNFLREARIWYNRSTDQMPVSDEFENVIALAPSADTNS